MKKDNTTSRRIWKRFSGMLLFPLFSIAVLPEVSAQAFFPPLPIEKRPHMKATATSEKISIDGKMDEAAWTRASLVTHFMASYPKQGIKASYETEVRVLYDEKYLYVGARCYFPPGKKMIQVQDMRRDFNFYNNEAFEVAIDPFKDPNLPVMAFSVTPYGTQLDLLHYVNGTYDNKWDAVWQAASNIQSDSWTAEFAIPFSTLRYPKNSTEWSINFIRSIRNLGEWNGWSLWPQAFSECRMAYAGILTGVVAPVPKTNLRFEPYTLVNSNSTNGHAATYKPEWGGEIKYALNTNTLLEGTINTDFAQADMDKEVINLTRSNVFYPENRQFFLENASLFSVGQNNFIQPFFSRSIGLSDSANPLTIKGGLRLVHQDSRQSMGLLMMSQDGDSSQTGAFFGVFRYKRSINSRLQLGGMALLRENQAGFKQRAYGNPVGVVDAFWKPSQPFFIRGMVSTSDNTLTRQKGWAAFSETSYVDNIFYLDWFEAVVSSGYQAQTGYVERSDFIHHQPTMGLTLYRSWFPKNIAFYNPQVSTDIYHQASTGIFQEAAVNLIPFQLNFTNLAILNLNTTFSWENLSAVFAPVRDVTIAPGQYHFRRYEIYGLSNQGAHYSLETRISTGGYYNGHMNSYYFSLRAAPLPHTSLVVSYTRNDFKRMGETGCATTTHLLAPELRLALNPRILLSAFYQYNTDTRNGVLNTRLSWEYRPLSFVYLVVNTLNNYYATPFGVPRQQVGGILKLTYIRQW